MDLEGLKPQIEAELGGTQLQLSDQTKNAFLEDALLEIGDDDSKVTPEFITRKANLLKSMNGQLHADVSTQVEEYKKNLPNKVEEPSKGDEGKGGEQGKKGGEEEPQYVKDLKAKIEKFESDQKQRDSQAAKDAVRDSVKKAFEAKQKEAKLEVNKYILKNVIRDLNIPDENPNASVLTNTIEREYNKAMKESGLINNDSPHHGLAEGSKGKSAVENFFAHKAKKEGWAKK